MRRILIATEADNNVSVVLMCVCNTAYLVLLLILLADYWLMCVCGCCTADTKRLTCAAERVPKRRAVGLGKGSERVFAFGLGQKVDA